MPPVAPPPPEDAAALHATFRPRRGRLVATWVAIAQGVLFVALALLVPSQGTGFAWGEPFFFVATSFSFCLLSLSSARRST